MLNHGGTNPILTIVEIIRIIEETIPTLTIAGITPIRTVVETIPTLKIEPTIRRNLEKDFTLMIEMSQTSVLIKFAITVKTKVTGRTIAENWRE